MAKSRVLWDDEDEREARVAEILERARRQRDRADALVTRTKALKKKAAAAPRKRRVKS